MNRLSWIILVIVLLAIAAVAGSYYYLQARPLTEVTIKEHEHEASEDVVIKVESALSIVERILRTARDWSAADVISIDNPRAFRQLLIPATHHRDMIGGARIADEEGREIALIKTPEGWETRETNIKKFGNRKHWFSWRDANTPVKEYWTTDEYDPRVRPWFVEALAAPEDQINWTQPYTLHLNKQPGLSASMRYTDRKTGKRFVVALNVLLLDISHFTTKIKYAKHGRVALLSDDGRLIGVPKHPQLDTDEAIKNAMLKTPGEVGLALLGEAMRQAKLSGENEPENKRKIINVLNSHSDDGEVWIAGFRPFKVRNQNFSIATLAPRSDFSVMSTELILALAGVMFGVLVVAAITSKLVINAFRRPLTDMYTQIEDDRRSVEVQMARRGTIAHVAQKMQEAESAEVLGNTLLAELAQRMALGKALFYVWKESEKHLELFASYAGRKSTDDVLYIQAGGLVNQCAESKAPILIENPQEDYFRIKSGLGDTLPKVILLYPIRYGDQLIAVLELASMRKLTEEDMILLSDIESFIAMSLDIRLRADTTEKALEATTSTKEQFRQILGLVRDGIWEVDGQGMSSFINQAALDMLGYDEGELLNKNMHELVQAHFEDGTPYAFSQSETYLTIHDGASRAVTGAALRKKNGQPMLADMHITAVKAENEIAGAIVLFHPSGASANVEMIQQSCEDHLWQILQASPTAAILEKMGGEVEHYNTSFADLFDVPPANGAIGSFREMWAVPEDYQAYLKKLSQDEMLDDFRTTLGMSGGTTKEVMLSSRIAPIVNKKFVVTWIRLKDRMGEDTQSEDHLNKVHTIEMLKMTELIGKLAAAITANEARAVDVWNEQPALLKKYFGDKTDNMEHAIRNLEFEKAGKILAGVVEQFGLAIRL